MKKILVIGGGAYQTPLIKRIIEQGYKAYCVDGNPNAVGFDFATSYKCIDVLDKQACLEYAKELNIDAVMTYGATLTLPTVAYIGEKLSLPTICQETAELSKNKYKIKKRLAEKGCNIKGEFFEISSRDEKYDFPIPCVVKPSDGSGSKGVALVYNENEIEDAINYAFAGARYGEVYVESLIDGEEYSAEAFVANGEIYVYTIVKSTFKKLLNGEISYGHKTSLDLPKHGECAISEEVKKAIKALNITIASVNFDVIVSNDDKKPYIIDCGIRVGQNLIASHIVPLSRGVSVIDNTIALALNENVDAAPKITRPIATRLLIYNPGVITEIKPMDDLIGKNGIIDIVLRKDVGDTQKAYKEKSDTCGWVITTGETADEAENNAIIAKELLKKYIIIE